MRFIDRQAKYPGRWTMKKSNGTSEVVTLVRNDEPIVEGTPMNANTFNSLFLNSDADTAKTASLVEYLCLLDGVPIESSVTPKDAYTAGHWNKGMVKLLVERQRLTAAEYENITGEPYTA